MVGGAIDRGHHADREEQQPSTYIASGDRSRGGRATTAGVGAAAATVAASLGAATSFTPGGPADAVRRTSKMPPAITTSASANLVIGRTVNDPVHGSHHGLHRVQEEHGADDGEDDPRDCARGPGIHRDSRIHPSTTELSRPSTGMNSHASR